MIKSSEIISLGIPGQLILIVQISRTTVVTDLGFSIIY